MKLITFYFLFLFLVLSLRVHSNTNQNSVKGIKKVSQISLTGSEAGSSLFQSVSSAENCCDRDQMRGEAHQMSPQEIQTFLNPVSKTPKKRRGLREGER